MPYKFETDKIRLPRDKKYKVRERQKARIRCLFKDGWSIRRIARLGVCSRRMVQFILFPERYASALELRRINGKNNNNYYKRERHKKYMKKYRRKKQKTLSLLKGGGKK